MTFTHDFFALALCAMAAGCATPSPPKEFPPGAQQIPAQALKDRLSGRSYTARLSNRTGWHMAYGADGSFRMRTSDGNSDQGRWRTEDSRMCVAFEGPFPSGCSEMRADDKLLYLQRRGTGEVVALEPAP